MSTGGQGRPKCVKERGLGGRSARPDPDGQSAMKGASSAGRGKKGGQTGEQLPRRGRARVPCAPRLARRPRAGFGPRRAGRAAPRALRAAEAAAAARWKRGRSPWAPMGGLPRPSRSDPTPPTALSGGRSLRLTAMPSPQQRLGWGRSTGTGQLVKACGPTWPVLTPAVRLSLLGFFLI
jgi:hypothetical protein